LVYNPAAMKAAYFVAQHRYLHIQAAQLPNFIAPQ
jgi:hypothetical protein